MNYECDTCGKVTEKPIMLRGVSIGDGNGGHRYLTEYKTSVIVCSGECAGEWITEHV